MELKIAEKSLINFTFTRGGKPFDISKYRFSAKVVKGTKDTVIFRMTKKRKPKASRSSSS